MDNNDFNNGYNGTDGFEPQKPFNDKSDASQEAGTENIQQNTQSTGTPDTAQGVCKADNTEGSENFAASENAEQAFADNADSSAGFDAPTESFEKNDAQNVREAAGGSNADGADAPQQGTDYSQPLYSQNYTGASDNCYDNGGYNGTAPYNNGGNAPSDRQYGGYAGYSCPQYDRSRQPSNNYGAPGGQPVNSGGGMNGANNQPYAPNGAPTPPYGQMPYPPYPPQPPKPPKQKTSKGVIALIAVLCVLLVGGAVGMSIYVSSVNNSSDSNAADSPYESFTLPNETTPATEEATTAQSEHEESDYSDQTDSDYSGLKLNSKPKDADSNSKYTAEYAYNQVSDSVVGVVCYSDEITTVENCSSQGSGIIISSDGYVVTNSHVVNNSKTAYLIQVVTADGTAYTAGVVGFDSRTDIAVLKMDDAKDLQAASFGDSDDIELAEDIIAVGNPGGLDYQNSITKGVVSAVNRSLSSTSLVKYIQTDAAINPGNSGGPIVNMYGQVIGIATSKIVSEKYEGMGFAIPSATVKEIVDDLIKNGYVSGRVKIGVTGSTVSSATASEYNVPQGILVQNITEDGPCDGTELQVGDIITEAGGVEITSFADIYEVLGSYQAGDTIELKYYRTDDGTEGTVEVVLQEDK